MTTLTETSLSWDLPVWQDFRKLVERAATELFDEPYPHDKIATTKINLIEKEVEEGHLRMGFPKADLRSYREAKRRCTDPKHRDYDRYGGRGIEFRLDDVADLFNAIGDRPPSTTLDRIDPDGHYEVGNVRWASPKEQANNRCQPQKICISPGWTGQAEAREEYLQTAWHWVLAVRGLSDPTSLSPEEAIS